MIRRFKNQDLDEIMSIWLHANMEAHSFIKADYWKNNYEPVKEMIPKAEVFVAEEEGKIIGFVGFTDNYIAGIFVNAAARSKGVGTELLRKVMEIRDVLNLKVYTKNTKAVMFYQHCGFEIADRGIDEDTSEEEYTMEWHRLAG